MYKLGLIGRIQNIPVSDLSDKYLTRFWTLMLSAAKSRIFLLDRLPQSLDEKSMSFFLEWMENFPGSIVVFGKNSNILTDFLSRKDQQTRLSRPLFDLAISFTNHGEAKTLINNQKKTVDDS